MLVGAGGTARAVMWALREIGCEQVTIVNRSDRSGEYAELSDGMDARFRALGADLAGVCMDADILVSTVPADALASYASTLGHAPVLDVIYNPWPTPLATRAASNGYPVVGGLSMLAGQSYAQFEQFTGVEAPRDAMRNALLRHWEQTH